MSTSLHVTWCRVCLAALLQNFNASGVFSVRPTGIFGESIGFYSTENLTENRIELVWYFLFIIFVTYTMLPLPLRTCMTLGSSTATLHVLYTLCRTLASSPEVRWDHPKSALCPHKLFSLQRALVTINVADRLNCPVLAMSAY